MKALLVAITAGALSVISAAQNAAPPNTGDTDASALNGTDLLAELNKSINSKKVKVGDPVKATVTQDVLAHGKIIIRRGSKLLGHVTEVKTRSRDDQESRLGVLFDRTIEKDGKEINFCAALRALAPGARLRTVDKPDQMTPPIVGSMAAPTSGPQRISSSSVSSSRSTTASNSGKNTGTRSSLLTLSKAGTELTADYGLISGGSRGVFGLPGLKLSRDQAAQSVVTSTTRNVKLDSGTQIVIQVINPAR